MNKIHMIDANIFGYSLCGEMLFSGNENLFDWTFVESNVTCEECLKIMNG